MQLKVPTWQVLVSFLGLLVIAVALQVAHEVLLRTVDDAGGLEWMQIVSSSIGIGSLGLLGLGTVQKDGA